MKDNKGNYSLIMQIKSYGSVHCTALFLIEIYLPMKFGVDTFNIFCVMLLTKYKYEKLQKGNYSLIMQKMSNGACTLLFYSS